MKEIILTAGISSLFTGILGFIAFLFSQIYYKSIDRYKELRARTAHSLVYYVNVYQNPIDLAKMPDCKLPERYDNATDQLRKLAADWSALIELKAKPGCFIPKDVELAEVSSCLIGISNGVTHPYNSIDPYIVDNNIKSVSKIKEILKIWINR